MENSIEALLPWKGVAALVWLVLLRPFLSRDRRAGPAARRVS